MATIFCVLICLGTFADGSETENYRFGIFEDQGKKIEIDFNSGAEGDGALDDVHELDGLRRDIGQPK